jgi:acetyl-CoA carboxylase biotin carboxylase subunit
MNTRLQVEHPVTELVTGIDLVREQINVAAGLPISFEQKDIEFRGHAIECRIYAEDPSQNFLPSPGRITRLQVPRGPGVRDDGGIYEDAEVSIHYDPMISKFAVLGRDRNEAIDRMRRALDEYQISGVRTTIPFFREVMRDDEFIAGKLDTGFIGRFFERLSLNVGTGQESETRDMAMIAAGIYQTETAPAINTIAKKRKLSPWVMSMR